jgi:hypothetical protein
LTDQRDVIAADLSTSAPPLGWLRRAFPALIPLMKFNAQEKMLLKLLQGWRCEAGEAGRNIKAYCRRL